MGQLDETVDPTMDENPVDGQLPTDAAISAPSPGYPAILGHFTLGVLSASVFVRQRRTATAAQIASTTPNGQAP